MTATSAGLSLAGQRPSAGLRPSSIAVLRMTALVAGGSLLAASATLWSSSGDFPHPWQQAAAALATLLLGLMVIASGTWVSGRSPYAALFVFSMYALLVIAFPLVRYIPMVYTMVYEQDLEGIFPPLWPYSLSIPLLIVLVGELALSRRERTAPVFLLAVSLVPASTLLFFGSVVVGKMATGYLFVAVPHYTLLARGACIGASSLIVLGAVAATRGLVWIGVVVLLGTGLFLETGSIFFYGGIPSDWGAYLRNPYSPWIPFIGGTVPGAATLLMSVMVLKFHVSRRQLPTAAHDPGAPMGQ